jgi:hypothetical protein
MRVSICPICGKAYQFREGYEENNRTCSSRECKSKWQDKNIRQEEKDDREVD